MPEHAEIHARVPKGGSRITKIHNERGQVTEAQVHDLHGKPVVRVVGDYDADGRLTEEKEISADFGEVSATLFTYDSQSRLTQKREPFDTIIGLVERVTDISYNEHGDKVEERAQPATDLQEPAQFATTTCTTATDTGQN